VRLVQVIGLTQGGIANIPPVQTTQSAQPLDVMWRCDWGKSADSYIVFNPVANYSVEARAKRTVGVVKLFGYFQWNGNVKIEGVMHGLPNGLTQEAIRAARHIKFIPTTQCDSSISEPVEIDYEFPSGGPGRLIKF